MGEEFKDFEVEAPVLTLEPDLTEEKEEIVKKEPEKPQEPAVEEPVLSPQEQKIVEDFAAKIDIENTNQILQYGAGSLPWLWRKQSLRYLSPGLDLTAWQ